MQLLQSMTKWRLSCVLGLISLCSLYLQFKFDESLNFLYCNDWPPDDNTYLHIQLPCHARTICYTRDYSKTKSSSNLNCCDGNPLVKWAPDEGAVTDLPINDLNISFLHLLTSVFIHLPGICAMPHFPSMDLFIVMQWWLSTKTASWCHITVKNSVNIAAFDLSYIFRQAYPWKDGITHLVTPWCGQ